MNMFLDKGKEHVLKQAGLTEEEEDDTEALDNPDEEFSCPLCCNDVTMSETSMLKACKERFCNDCWRVRYFIINLQKNRPILL